MRRPRFAPTSAAAFNHRPFRLYWSAQLISMMGTFMQQVALGYLVYNLTGSKWLLGTISALQLGPSLFLSLPAGVVADRVQRKRLVMCTQSVALLLSFTLATLIALHRLQIWEILVISTISGIAIATEGPARQAFVVDLVGREDLPNAIAWNSLIVNGARVIGPAIGGIAIRFVGIPPIFYYNSFSFLVMILTLLAMGPIATPRTTARNPFAEARDGLAYVRNSPAIMLILAMLFVVATFALNYAVLMPILARDLLHTGADGLGWMWTAFGVGAVIGSFTVVSRSEAAVRGPLLLTASLVAGANELAMAAARTMPVMLALLVLVGWGTGAFVASANSAVQARVHDAVRGRVLSVYAMIFAGTAPVGGLLAAWLASLGGAPLSLAVNGGIGTITSLALAMPFLRALRGTVGPAQVSTIEADRPVAKQA